MKIKLECDLEYDPDEYIMNLNEIKNWLTTNLEDGYFIVLSIEVKNYK